jgi:mannosyltransferase
VLALAGWLVADHALRKPSVGRLTLLAVLTGALLWTHYWGIWLTAASGLGLLARAAVGWRAGDRERVRDSLLVAGALVAGTVLFLPWVPTLLSQSEHTGTPWAQPSIPTEVASTSLLDLGGGSAGESILLAMALVLAIFLGLTAAPGRGPRLELDLRTRPEVRRMALVVVGTLAVAVAVSYVADAAYATRYFSVVAPLVLVLVGVGISRIGGPVAFRIALAALLLLGAVSGVRTAVSRPRTQARQVAEAIEAAAGTAPGGPLVVVCPDQLGPALSRELPDGVEVGTYPRFEAPELVDWVDYEARLAGEDPVAFADEAVARAGDRDVWLVWSGTYRTHEGTCEAVANELQRLRPAGAPVVLADADAYEPSNAFRYPAG